MKIAIVGKGGSGKTTVAAGVARSLARQGLKVVALDCDTSPNLGISLGLGMQVTEALVAIAESAEADRLPSPGWKALIDRCGLLAPDHVRLVVVGGNENPCRRAPVTAGQVLGLAPGDATVVADFGGGLGALAALDEQAGLDIVIVVVEPSAKSLGVGVRVSGLVRERAIGRVLVVANRICNSAQLATVREAFPRDEVFVVPEDPSIEGADRAGVAAIDAAPESPGVRALAHLADTQLGIWGGLDTPWPTGATRTAVCSEATHDGAPAS